jgi:hypothetical protein
MISTDEGISIRRSDVHPSKPETSLRLRLDENIISFRDVHRRKPYFQVTSTDEGISIRRMDVHPSKPETFLR